MLHYLNLQRYPTDPRMLYGQVGHITLLSELVLEMPMTSKMLRLSTAPLFLDICRLRISHVWLLHTYWVSLSVDVFFVYHPFAKHIFHEPSFLATMNLPPNHHSFPHISESCNTIMTWKRWIACLAILHAICAVGSLYTPQVAPPPMPNFNETPAGKPLISLIIWLRINSNGYIRWHLSDSL